ncbi:hypothetical protein C0J52_09828 [Blattella germanica]|nr:hypothetical protein C0J52_09828 [Blattella germanica]
MYNRPNIFTMYNVTGWPIALPNNTAFDGTKTTVLFIPGWYHSLQDQSYEQLKDAYLKRVDVNYIFLDWEKCAQDRYLQTVSTARVIAAQAIRFLKYLCRYHKAYPSKMHFIGIGIGVHIASYIAKGLGGIKRITGLQPTSLLFDGYGKEVRLDIGDADFVEVGYTETLSTINKGHVEYYFNGFLSQPGCKHQVGEKALQALQEGHFNIIKISLQEEVMQRTQLEFKTVLLILAHHGGYKLINILQEDHSL